MQRIPSSLFRWALLGLALSYAVLLPLKLAERLPSHVTWLKLAAAPAALFGLLLVLLYWNESANRS